MQVLWPSRGLKLPVTSIFSASPASTKGTRQVGDALVLSTHIGGSFTFRELESRGLPRTCLSGSIDRARVVAFHLRVPVFNI
jgi:hypothetical protein